MAFRIDERALAEGKSLGDLGPEGLRQCNLLPPGRPRGCPLFGFGQRGFGECESMELRQMPVRILRDGLTDASRSSGSH